LPKEEEEEEERGAVEHGSHRRVGLCDRTTPMTITLWDEMAERFSNDAIKKAARVFDVFVREWNGRKSLVAKDNRTVFDWGSETEETFFVVEW
jgi:hypothetical protein